MQKILYNNLKYKIIQENKVASRKYSRYTVSDHSRYRNLTHMSEPLSIKGLEQRIDEACRLIGDRAAAATAAGVSEDMLRRYIRGDSKPGFEVVVNLARAACLDLNWLAYGEESCAVRGQARTLPSVVDTLGQPVDLEEFVFIPRYEIDAAAGHGAWPEDESPRFSMAFRRYWIENHLRADPAQLSVITVKGDSMEGVLNNRDIILINHADNKPADGIYVLRIDGDLIVKRIQRLPGSRLELKSANDAYTPFSINLNDLSDNGHVSIIGRVVWFARQIA